jgi:hypothetical protein
MDLKKKKIASSKLILFAVNFDIYPVDPDTFQLVQKTFP